MSILPKLLQSKVSKSSPLALSGSLFRHAGQKLALTVAACASSSPLDTGGLKKGLPRHNGIGFSVSKVEVVKWIADIW